MGFWGSKFRDMFLGFHAHPLSNNPKRAPPEKTHAMMAMRMESTNVHTEGMPDGGVGEELPENVGATSFPAFLVQRTTPLLL